ncbi:MAG: hypothetical protein WBC78_01660 [Candidatus Sulfotelmatobacter sp.]
MKVSKSGLYLLVAALLIATSVPLATRGLASANIPTALGRVFVGALLMFCGVFMVATVLRSRLVIEESQIRLRVVFREEVFPLKQIEGVRTVSTGPSSHHVSRRVIYARGRTGPIEIIQFDSDDFLQRWLQQLPNLDQPAQSSSSENLFRKTD